MASVLKNTVAPRFVIMLVREFCGHTSGRFEPKPRLFM